MRGRVGSPIVNVSLRAVMSQLARDNRIGSSTAYDYRDEAIAVLAARRPSLHGVQTRQAQLTIGSN